jgi:hypothetical protein
MRISIALLLALASGAHCFVCPYGAVNYPDSNTQHACANHGKDFGHTGGCAGKELIAFRETLIKFEFQKANKCCQGRYKNQPALIVYQTTSHLALIADSANKNTLISGWLLGQAQYDAVASSCSLSFHSGISEHLLVQTPFD